MNVCGWKRRVVRWGALAAALAAVSVGAGCTSLLIDAFEPKSKAAREEYRRNFDHTDSDWLF